MTDSSRAVCGVLFLVGHTLLAACSGSLPDEARDAAASRAIDPGYSALGTEIIETGADGKQRYRLRADRLQQDPTSMDIQLTGLAMDLVTARQGTWRVTARQGRMPQSAQRIDLSGDVTLASLGGEHIEIRTEALTLEPEAERATSATTVVIRTFGKSLSAKGMEANLKQQTLRLESTVHGRFVP